MKDRFKITVFILIMLVIVSGCQNTSQQQQESQREEGAINQPSEPYLTFKDFDGETVTLQDKPQNIVILNEQVLHSFYQVGGKAVGVPTPFNVEAPEEAAQVPKVGYMHEVSMEKVLALKPDLVIGQRFDHGKLREIFKEANIPLANLNTQSIEDIKQNTILMGKITGNEQKAEELVDQMNSEINQVIEQIPDEKEMPTYAILTVMGDTAYVEQSSTIAVDIADQLKLRNATVSIGGEAFAGYIPFSMEEMVMINPDYLFILSHTTNAEAEAMIEKNFKSNPAWSSLSAISNDHMYVLPKDKFVTAPGVDVTESYKYMADLITQSQTN
ncbi:iron complex transport system substrate-binding protein [Paenibacillus sp. JGP012]|uniref:ABC transporter substrate-binding protein n=1 Tax=Paenibacillus sp. JGP012 TaxID=2735914 RepID=UPI00161F783F|nr:ABC transporter substrate-binding protein [Paenibacillus sp. JGP012]MBB6021884.1 iron complex transport system substrate-binding protein [Paenibacillus sp. JGP012]